MLCSPVLSACVVEVLFQLFQGGQFEAGLGYDCFFCLRFGMRGVLLSCVADLISGMERGS